MKLNGELINELKDVFIYENMERYFIQLNFKLKDDKTKRVARIKHSKNNLSFFATYLYRDKNIFLKDLAFCCDELNIHNNSEDEESKYDSFDYSHFKITTPRVVTRHNATVVELFEDTIKDGENNDDGCVRSS